MINLLQWDVLLMILTNSTGIYVVSFPPSLIFLLLNYLYHQSTSLMMLCPKLKATKYLFVHWSRLPLWAPLSLPSLHPIASNPIKIRVVVDRITLPMENLVVMVAITEIAIAPSAAKSAVVKVTKPLMPRALYSAP